MPSPVWWMERLPGFGTCQYNLADDAFMAISFLARMGKMTGDEKYFNDAANQVLNYTRYLWCPEKNIYYHCYHTDTKEHGVAHWSRANGWVFMAQADLLSVMPEDHPMRDAVIENFRRQASGVARYQGKMACGTNCWIKKILMRKLPEQPCLFRYCSWS